MGSIEDEPFDQNDGGEILADRTGDHQGVRTQLRLRQLVGKSKYTAEEKAFLEEID